MPKSFTTEVPCNSGTFIIYTESRGWVTKSWRTKVRLSSGSTSTLYHTFYLWGVKLDPESTKLVKMFHNLLASKLREYGVGKMGYAFDEMTELLKKIEPLIKSEEIEKAKYILTA